MLNDKKWIIIHKKSVIMNERKKIIWSFLVYGIKREITWIKCSYHVEYKGDRGAIYRACIKYV